MIRRSVDSCVFLWSPTFETLLSCIPYSDTLYNNKYGECV